MPEVCKSTVRRWKNDASEILETVSGLLYDQKHEQIISILRSLKKPEKRFLMSQEDCCFMTPLCRAVFTVKDSVRMIEYFVQECDADIEQPMKDDLFCGTPLALAVSWKHTMAAIALIQLGANIHNTADGENHSPIATTCITGNLQLLTYMVDVVGFDINMLHKSDRYDNYGRSCLMLSVHYPKLCEFLINRGADLEVQDRFGHTAFYYAVCEGKEETVDIFFDKGVHYVQDDQNDNDLLMSAATNENISMVTYLIRKMQEPILRQIHAYEVLGAIIDTNAEYGKTSVQRSKYWRKAMEMRYKNPENPILKIFQENINQVYRNVREPSNMKELDQVLLVNDGNYIHRILLLERILGDSNFNFIKVMETLVRCIHDGDNKWYNHNDLRFSFEVYFLQLVAKKETLMLKFGAKATNDVESNLRFLKFDKVPTSGNVEEQINILNAITDMINCISKARSTACANSGWTVCELVKHGFNFILSLRRANIPIENPAIQRFQNFIRENKPKDEDGRGLVNLASKKWYLFENKLEVINLLLDCGQDVNLFDRKWNEPIPLLSLLDDRNISYELKDTTDHMMKCGAHPCVRNDRGETFIDLLPSNIRDCYSYLFPKSLQCLAADKVADFQILYREMVPKRLAGFVDLHIPMPTEDLDDSF